MSSSPWFFQSNLGRYWFLRRAAAWSALLLIAVALALLPLRDALLLAGGSMATILLLRWPWLIWLPLAAALPVTSGLKQGVVSVTDLLLAAGVALWFFDGARRRTLLLRGSLPVGLATVYIAALSLSTFGAVELGEALAEVIKWLELLVLLLVVPSMVGPAQARWLAAALVLGGIGQGLLGLYQFVFRIGPEYFLILGQFMRASGVFAQPNPYGGYLGLTLPVALSLAIWAWSAWLRQPIRQWTALLWSLYFTAGTAMIGAGLLASWSRGAWLGAVVGATVVLILRSRLAALLSGVVVLVLLAALLLGAFSPEAIPAPIAERLQDLPEYFGFTDVLSQPVTDENFSVIERIAHWVAAQRMWELSPWLGVGPGNYAAVYPQVRLPRWEEPLGHAHNVYLNVLGESGLVGLAAYLTLWLAIVFWVWRRIRATAACNSEICRWFSALGIGVLGVVGHLSTHNLVDNLFVQGMVVHIGLWLALLHINWHGESH